jgi:hypothetical protein
MKFLCYREFILNESWPNGPAFDDSFIEKFENVITELEKRLEKEIPDFNSGKWWDDMIELDKEVEFENEIEKLAGNWFNKLYTGKYNAEYGEPEVTPEYLRVEKSIEGKYAKPGQNTKMTGIASYNQRRRTLDNALLQNCIEKHWNEWKAVYLKWIDFVNKKRGYLTGKNYGLS